MKKAVLILVALLFSFSSNAQGVQLGPKAGVNLSTFSGDETDDLSSKFGIHFGVVAEFGISETFSVQPEVIYSAQGAEYEESEGYDGKFKFNYLNVPVLAKVEVTDGLHLEAGPQIGFLLTAEDEYDDGAGDSGTDDIKEFFKGTDFAVAVGASYKMASGLFFGARYNIGVTDIWDVDSGISNQTSVFQFSLGYLFNLAGNSN
ncbi:MAG: PorT family protein [Bacteroidia bacterium]|nr:PorT family protein [Bacteroidia bacterium]MBT8267790.1 PorT family protein [Bacteroidia bacterium]NNK70907.1 PorT family protein [Flavobacteriaceae bacterium]NNL79326.1 PorT family protein [Flavobacteriaceae bacterium]